jgi:L-threonylcarbamoyladenylate synthase
MPNCLSIDPQSPDPETLDKAVQVIESGGVVAFPTETFYGLAVDPENVLSVQKLFKVKGRDSAKAIPLIASDVVQVESRISSLSVNELHLANRFWPGPFALVIRASENLASNLHAGTVAVRVPGHTMARMLVSQVGRPITATSANMSGTLPAISADEVYEKLGSALDLILDGGPTPGGVASTIVRVDQSGPVLIRAGVLPWERVLESFSSVK